MSSRTFSNKKIRLMISSVLALALAFSVGSLVSAETLNRQAPRVVWDKEVELPLDSIYEHGQREILAAYLRNDQITVNSISTGGVKKEKVTFPKYNISYLASFHQTRGGGYISTGGKEILKVNGQGNKDWEYTLSLENTYLKSVDQLVDGSYIVAGTTPGSLGQERDLILVKLAGNGKLIWQKTLRKATEDSVSLVKHTEDGGFILLGEATSQEGTGTVTLSKFSSTSKLEWEKSFAPAQDSQNLWNTALVQDKDGGYVISGFYNHPNPNHNIRNLTTGYILKTDVQGNLLWSHPLDSSLDRSYANDVQLAAGGGYIVTGKTNEDWHGTVSKAFVQRLNNSGMVLWTTIIERTEPINRGVIVLSSPGGYLILGDAYDRVKATKLSPQ
ncbi:hypothetical protein [Paenibacillus sp. YPG26]|uniref:hypothetical protein n=1 Tax=Paenibacillus sp. YPG26 TaxID=2878915 RepID=UPI00203C901A|nr:hypothetical protein [Paenibacillus sp. YPG26]USB31892.1 hypothetical protein LDO05_11085 [Paenibacillus sp. YPG26]